MKSKDKDKAKLVAGAVGARQVGKVIGRRTVRDNNKKDDNIKD